MESKEYENNLVDGFAYLELKKVFSRAKDGSDNPLTSKNGNLMLSLQWSAIDVHGNTGVAFDHIVINDKTAFKLQNIETALGAKNANGLYDKDRGFNLAFFGERTNCCAVLEKDEYGSKIKRYVPLEFCKALVNFNNTENNSKKIEFELEAKFMPAAQSQNSLNYVKIEEEDDGIPF